MTENKADKTHAEIEEEKSMCRHGFHEWIPKEGETLDESGKPVAMLKCARCGKEKKKAETSA